MTKFAATPKGKKVANIYLIGNLGSSRIKNARSFSLQANPGNFQVQARQFLSNSLLWRTNRPKALLLYQIGHDDGSNYPNILSDYIMPQLLLAEKILGRTSFLSRK